MKQSKKHVGSSLDEFLKEEDILKRLDEKSVANVTVRRYIRRDVGMKTVEFEGTVAADGQIAVPPEVAQQIPAGEPVHVVVLWGASDLDADWRAAGRRRFEEAYAPGDSIYEQLIDDASPR